MTRTEAYIQMLYGNKVEHMWYPNVVFTLNDKRKVVSIDNTKHIHTIFMNHPSLASGWRVHIEEHTYTNLPFSTGGIPPYEIATYDNSL